MNTKETLDTVRVVLNDYRARGAPPHPLHKEALAALDTLREEIERLKRDVAAESENASVFMAQLERQEAALQRLILAVKNTGNENLLAVLTPPNQEDEQ